MDSSSSSKVTVEYHDPSGLFSLIQPDITARLPLRNLQWQNATRPLRQINSLHLDFVPDAWTKNTLRPHVQLTDSNGTTSFDIVRSGADPRRDAVKERRHQIPGLQTSPYLRIYILRSDEKDTYKATERQKIRAWIRDNAAASTSKGKSENHGACEWLVIHVVVPDTTASSEPRWRESSKDPEELKERKQGMKLPGKSTRTVFDKLRADFNDSGKGSLDRVAQIRLTRAQMPPDLLPTPAQATTIEETNEEREKAWNDLMSKMKTLILPPFDLRIRQYEADVAEQELRRSMPGFNFCTFFIHKEGLAKALESVGLVEDALVIYDELSLGLETVIRDIARGQAGGTATTFAPYTDDFADRIVGLNVSRTNGVSSNDAGKGAFEIDYREKIVRSDISVFDFFSYLFTRQKVLILRIANAKSATAFTKDGTEDILLISEVCWRATSFIHNNARTLRQDLSALRKAQWEKQSDSTLSGADIESLVCSWTYTVAGRILDETESTSVDQFSDLSKRDSMPNGSVHTHNRSDSHLPSAASSHPHRTTSLPPRKHRISELQGRTSLQSASENDLWSPRSSSTNDDLKAGGVQPGLLELVTYRAELFMMQRKMLELLAKQRGWLAGWATLKEQNKPDMEEVDLNGDIELPTKDENTRKDTASTLTTPALASALESKASFHKAYERLSDKAMRLYVAATQTKTAESIMGDLAILKSQQGDYVYAVSYFQHVLPLYAADGWSLLEDEALVMNAHCLKELGRADEYVTVHLTILAKACGRRKAARMPQSKISNDVELDVKGIFPSLISFSESLDGDFTNPAEHFFDIQVEREIMHPDDSDGFILSLGMHHWLEDDLELKTLSARLVHADDPSLEIWLSNDNPGNLRCGENSFTLEAHAIAFGPYLVDRVVTQAGKLCFVHEFSKTRPTLPEHEEKPLSQDDAYKQPWVFLYPLRQAFDAEIRVAKNIHVDRTRYLEIDLKSGWNDITSISMKLKPASAGLRLHLGDAILESIDSGPDDSKPGQISLGSVRPDSAARVRVPYSLEQTTPDILVRFDATFSTSKGTFSMSKSLKLVTELPLDVDVNDIFHLDYLFSNFTIRSTRGVPLTISGVNLQSSPVYDVEAPPRLHLPMSVFDQQPVKLVYKITRSLSEEQTTTKAAAIALSAKYSCIDELVLSILGDTIGKALESSPYGRLSRLVIPILCERAKQLYTRSDLEMATLLNEIRIPAFVEIGWTEILKTLPKTIKSDLSYWLENWHRENEQVAFEDTTGFPDAQRSITISVDVPRVNYVHEVSISMPKREDPNPEDLQLLSLGRPTKATVSVHSTSNWSNAAVFQSKQSPDSESSADFMLDIHADPDCWLVGGQRRMRFTAKPHEELTFDIKLIPLRLGHHPLPTIDIQPVHPTPEDDSKIKEPVSCETHNQSAGQVFQVIRGLRRSQVPISESASTGRPSSRPSTAAMTKEAG